MARDSVQAAADRRDRLIAVLIGAFVVSFFGGALYVVAHFIIKFW